MNSVKIGIIGGGAAGFFAAIHVKENFPEAKVAILEKSNKFLSKVKISGGGRCNVTNACSSISELSKAYPRGGKQLKKLFPEFNTKHTRDWFESRNVPLIVQEDQCIFPRSQDSQTIIDCFWEEVHRLGIYTKAGVNIQEITCTENGFQLINREGETFEYNKIIVATGGSPKHSGLEWLEKLGHKIETPVPSLFTFNMPEEPVRNLMGVVVENTITKIKGEKISASGPLLITHWGMSGPAILVLSAFGARILSEKNYHFTIQVNWVNELNQNKVFEHLTELSAEHAQKQIQNIKPYFLPSRLWHFLINKTELPLDRRWCELGKKGLNKLLNVLTNDEYAVKGKTTFKEEFVTCGGVSLESVNMKTLESKVCPNLFFAGEVLDIDAITGGYNFQAAWTTGYVAARLGT
ncbi:MAG: NAD(P)/FAD-dependent oxidoreductase [Brumimicrobium sp.]|nr:NAD(P)/FAD-dependent oxidoreductase [Brumimicrobium sp.]